VSARLCLVVLVVFAFACGSRAETPALGGTASPSSASTTAAAIASPAATPSPTATPRPNPTAGPGIYTSLAYAYRIELPAGWRRSACQSARDPSQPPAIETFTNATVEAESGTDTGPGQDVVLVRVEENAGGQSALNWLESGKMGFSMGSTFEKITFDNNPDAARIVTTDGATTVAIVVNARSRMYAVSRGLREPTPPAEAAARAIMTSLHILRDNELGEARATLATPAPAPARSAEEVADTLARGFGQKDTTVLASVSEECVQSASENAGGSFSATSVTMADMRKAFANGFVVTVQARPLVDQTVANASVLATWKDAGQPQRNVKLMMTKVGNTWYWIGVLFLRG
jgi:hypothetical protein